MRKLPIKRKRFYPRSRPEDVHRVWGLATRLKHRRIKGKRNKA